MIANKVADRRIHPFSLLILALRIGCKHTLTVGTAHKGLLYSVRDCAIRILAVVFEREALWRILP